jgi:hypothetical protein
VGHVSLREVLRSHLQRLNGTRVVSSLILDYLHLTHPGHELVAELLEHRIARAAEEGVPSGVRHAPGRCLRRHPATGPAPIPAREMATVDEMATPTAERDGGGGGGSHHRHHRQKLPALADSSTVAAGGATCAFGRLMLPLVRHAAGFEYSVERSKLGQPKPGYVARSPAAQLDVCVSLPPKWADRDAPHHFSFAYLRSYASGMGRVTSTCHVACECLPMQVDAHSPGSLTSLTEVSPGQSILRGPSSARPRGRAATDGGDARCECVVRLTVDNGTSSGGHKFKVVALFAGLRVRNGYDMEVVHQANQMWG